MKHTMVSPIRRAANIMVRRPDYPELKREACQLIAMAYGYFTGELSPLNALVEYGRDRGAGSLEKLWKLLDRKHRDLFPRDPKADYQAGYMKERRLRLRLRKAITLYEQVTGDRLTADEKANFRQHQQAAWIAQREKLMLKSGNVPLDQRNEVSRQFWAGIERNLDQALAGDDRAIGQFMKDH